MNGEGVRIFGGLPQYFGDSCDQIIPFETERYRELLLRHKTAMHHFTNVFESRGTFTES